MLRLGRQGQGDKRYSGNLSIDFAAAVVQEVQLSWSLVNQKVSSSFSLHPKVFLGRILNPRLSPESVSLCTNAKGAYP